MQKKMGAQVDGCGGGGGGAYSVRKKGLEKLYSDPKRHVAVTSPTG